MCHSLSLRLWILRRVKADRKIPVSLVRSSIHREMLYSSAGVCSIPAQFSTPKGKCYSVLSINVRMPFRNSLTKSTNFLDVLNRCPDSSNLSQTVHLMKYIFPRQFGIHNVFTSRVDSRETVQPFKDYTVREDEIETVKRAARVKKGLDLTTKLPKRLRGELVSLIQKLQKRHTRCAYNELLKYYCPIEVYDFSFPT